MEIGELIARVEREALDESPLTRIVRATMLASELTALGDEVVDHFVDAARREGCSWAQIGSALGVTRQAAQQRHGGLVRRLVGGCGRPLPITRFGSDARRSVVEAQVVARAHRSDHVDTEHLLAGILRASPNTAAEVLSDRGLSREDVEERIAAAADPRTPPRTGQIPFAPAAKKVLELSLREAIALGAKRIGTEHLLLGMLRERQGGAAEPLARHGVDRAHVLAAIDPRRRAPGA